MIFVTVGTHEQPFDRLIKEVDRLKKENIIEDEIIVQTGFCTEPPRYCRSDRFFPYGQMQQYIKQADIVITHGGPASFIPVLQYGKVPIVVPRQKAFGEHVNDHQLDFVCKAAERMGNIVPVIDIGQLAGTLLRYPQITQQMQTDICGNNRRFNEEFEKLVDQLLWSSVAE